MMENPNRLTLIRCQAKKMQYVSKDWILEKESSNKSKRIECQTDKGNLNMSKRIRCKLSDEVSASQG